MMSVDVIGAWLSMKDRYIKMVHLVYLLFAVLLSLLLCYNFCLFMSFNFGDNE